MKRLVTVGSAEFLFDSDAARKKLHKVAMELREASGQDEVMIQRLSPWSDTEKYLVWTLTH